MKKTKNILQLIPLFFLLISIAILLSANTSLGSNHDSVTFKWQANPANENILGYRIYYGTNSRFNSDKSLKQNFNYNQVIDLTEMLKCYGPDYTSCEIITEDQLKCINLDTEDPECTLSNLSVTPLYFAMTAYSSVTESQYTPELKWNTSSIMAIQEIVNFLLLSEE